MADDFRVSVRIGAMLDSRSVDSTLGDFRRKSEKAAQDASAAFARAERARTSIVKAAARDHVASEREATREITALMRQQASEARKAQADIRREHAATEREAAQLRRHALSEERKAATESKRIQREADRERESFARRTSHRATRFLFPQPEGAFGYARRVGHDVMRGMGMDWTLSAGLQRSRENRSAAVALSNQGYIPGQGRFEDRIGADSIRNTSKRVANDYAFAESEVTGAMTKFTDVTGDLKTAQEIIDQIALLSKATNTNIEDAASSAADFSMQLGDIPNKSAVVARLLSVAAMGGKAGAVEMKELAKTVPLIASQASALGPDREENIGKLLAVTQTARQFGGAGNAFKAATATAGMVGALQTPARVAEFRAHFKKFTGGRKDIYDAGGNLRDIQEIIKDSVTAAGTDKNRQVEFNKMWGNIRAGKAVGGFMNISNQAGGGAAGLAAIDAQFAKFTKALDKSEQERLKNQAVSTPEARAARFQTALDAVADKLMTNLAGPLEQLEPKIKMLVEAFSTAIEFTSNNLGSAIMLAVTASVARAGLESGFRTIVDRFMGAAGGAVSVSQGFGTLGGAVANTTLTLGTLALAFAATTAALNVWDEYLNKKSMTEAGSLTELDTSYQLSTRNIDSNATLTPEQKQEKKAELARQAMKRLEWIEKEQGAADWLPEWAQSKNHVKNKGIEMSMRSQYARDQVTDSSAAAAGAADPALLARALQEGILQVRVVNAQDMKSPSGGNSDAPTADRGNSGR